MKPIRTLSSLILLVAIAAPPAPARPQGTPPAAALTPQEALQGWIMLFDGATSFGWAPRGDAQFQVQDGALVAASGGRGMLSTTTEFADFTLKAQVWIDADANSGIFLRCPTTGEISEANAYEVNIYDAHAMWPTGSINRVGKTRLPVKTVGRWSDFQIQAVGDRLQVWVDGKQTLDARDAKYARGTIALQYNGKGTVKFRNLRLQPASLKSIFNGKDLSGWKVIAGHKSVYTVTPEGWLNVTDGNGSIQTEGQWGDLVMQIDIISNGDHLNSGVFFREPSGSFWGGYEAQIRNQWTGDDRTKPVDFGTGAIYNRQAARKVVPSDREWFTMTIIAHGSHMATWVNGYQTADFTDTRPVNDSPRQGLRTQPGAISLQGHDPTTNLSFRNIKVVELPAVAPR